MNSNIESGMTPQGSEIEAQVHNGETFEVNSRGNPTMQITPATPCRILVWEDHLATAIPSTGHSVEETVAADREGRW